MKNSFVIKSFQNGINLKLNPDVPFEQLLQDIAQKFNESRSFFGTASVALSIEGRNLSQEEEMSIIDVINDNSDLSIICIVGKDDVQNGNFIKALQTLQSKLPSSDYAQFYKGSIKDNEVIEMEDSVIVMGDVNPGCVITSAKNIIVLGRLCGEAHAGTETGDSAYIIALEMEPTSLCIGNFKYRPMKKSKWRIQSKIQPKVAVVKGNNVEIVPLTKEILDAL
ncbi:MAG: septum site-determining protein MinC [Lachnospiraceae bacterium]|nr:septum site-determining protein MinC [Lachnospiraceae bacterium]